MRKDEEVAVEEAKVCVCGGEQLTHTHVHVCSYRIIIHNRFKVKVKVVATIK